MEFTQQQLISIGLGVATVIIIMFLIQIAMYLRIKKRQKIILERDIESNSLGGNDVSSFREKLKTIDTKLGYLDDSFSTIMFQLDELSKTIDKEFVSVKNSVDFKKHLVASNNATPIEELQSNPTRTPQVKVQSEPQILSPRDVLRDLTPGKEEKKLPDDLDLNRSTIYNIYGNKYDADEDTKIIKKDSVSEEQKIIDYFKNLDDFSEKMDENMQTNMDQDELAKTMKVSKSELEFVRSFNKLRGGE